MRKRVDVDVFSGSVKRGFVVNLDEAELTLRFVETVLGRTRLPGRTPIEMLDRIEAGDDTVTRMMAADLRRCAKTAMHYFAEQVSKASAPPGRAMTMAPIDPDKGPLQ